MGYLLELSMNLNKTSNISEIKYKIITKAEECHVISYHDLYEFMGKNRNIHRNHYVLSFTFEEHVELVIHFIQYIKSLKCVNIESLGYDNVVFKLMYASKKYLNLMDKYQAKKYLEEKRHGSLFQQDSPIIKAIIKKT